MQMAICARTRAWTRADFERWIFDLNAHSLTARMATDSTNTNASSSPSVTPSFSQAEKGAFVRSKLEDAAFAMEVTYWMRTLKTDRSSAERVVRALASSDVERSSKK
jgi:hypothetical protein